LERENGKNDNRLVTLNVNLWPYNVNDHNKVTDRLVFPVKTLLFLKHCFCENDHQNLG